MLRSLVSNIGAIFRKIFRLNPPPPITTLAEAEHYLAGTSAYISQFTLYAYVKARAGTRFPELFENETYLTSLKIARWHIYAACLSDLCLYFGARLAAQARCPADECARITSQLMAAALAQQNQDDIEQDALLAYLPRYEERIRQIDWFSYAVGPDAFSTSPEALMEWAPIDEGMKAQDAGNVTHNLGMRWKHIRAELVSRLEADAVLDDAKKTAQPM